MNLGNFGVEIKTNKPQAIDCEGLDVDLKEVQKVFDVEKSERFLPWFLKYQIRTIDDVVETPQIRKVRKFFENPPLKKGLLLVGKAGCGKTTTLTLFARYFGFECIEMNASDTRNKKSIQEFLYNVLTQKSLFQKKKIILIDEVDGVSARKDRGGISQIIHYLKSFSVPMVFTANFEDSPSIKQLKKFCEVVNFEVHTHAILEDVSKKILREEGVEFENEELLEFLKRRDTSDIRGFINDLQASCVGGKFEFNESLEVRDYKAKIEGILRGILYSYPDDAYLKVKYVDVSLDDLFLYLEENIPLAYTWRDVGVAFDFLSKADVFKGRISKWQYWRYLVYCYFFVSFGVCASKSSPIEKVDFKRNRRLLQKFILQNSYKMLFPRTKLQKKKDSPETFIEKLSQKLKRSVVRVRKEDINYISFMYRSNLLFRRKFNSEFDADEKLKKTLLKL